MISESTSSPAPRLRVALRRRDLLLALPPAALFLAWVVLFLASFGAIVEVIYADADISSATMIGELFPKAPGDASTVLGYHPWYSTLWFELATHWLPGYRHVWEVGPWVVSVIGIALVGWATAKVAGRWTGWLVAIVLVCAGTRLLPIQFGSDIHGATAVNVCFLDAFLVLLVLHGGRIGRPLAHVVLCALITIVTAIGLSSDVLLMPAGVIPFIAAGLMQLRWAPGAIGKRIAVAAGLIGAASIVLAEIAVAAMHRVHVYTGAHTIAFARFDDLVGNVVHYFQSLADLFNGDFGGAAITARSSLELACAVAVGFAFVLAVRLGLDQVDRLRAAESAISAGREAHVGFWFAAIVLTSVAFVLSSIVTLSLGRYIVAVGYGVIVLAAVSLAGRSYAARAVGIAAACILVAGSVVALAKRDLTSNPGHYPRNADARLIGTFAQGEGLKYGYAAYWDAAPVTWESKLGVEVYPVITCPAPSGLCTYPWHEISSWYKPRPSTRSFLIADPRYGPPTTDFDLGKPDEVVTLGDYKLYVYPFDIASRLGDPKPYGINGS
ncbi:MAG TPA: hypothetical protein VGH35_02705 [Gaiellaceae bacterium]|jgi:hypothetical protein